jgi:hypothetical protein
MELESNVEKVTFFVMRVLPRGLQMESTNLFPEDFFLVLILLARKSCLTSTLQMFAFVQVTLSCWVSIL